MLTDNEKKFIKAETNWSDVIISSIRSFDEFRIYRHLTEELVDGIPCLVVAEKPSEDNIKKMKKGQARRDNSNKPYELHHIGGKPDAPLAELTHEEHHLNGNFRILHDTYNKKSLINRKQFRKIRKNHWRARANAFSSK